MKIGELIAFIENLYPVEYQEDYDNSGFIIGDPQTEISKVLLSIDVTEQVINEAIQKRANLIVSHHPPIFFPIKKITPFSYEGKIIFQAIKNNIAIYSAHTSLDLSFEGINMLIAKKLGLKNLKIFSPLKNKLFKLVTFVPKDYAEKIRKAIFEAGAGVIGNYDNCSYNTDGYGTFRPNENTNPFVGEKGKIHFEQEVRIETIFPQHLENQIIKALISAHPYEEVAYDIYPLENTYPLKGFGIYGETSEPMPQIEILNKIKNILNVKCLKYSKITDKKVKKIGICSGACGFLIKKAVASGLDVFISGEIKYHDYVSYEGKILLVEAGHFETEVLINELFYDLFTKNFNFEVLISEYKNPVDCL